jgi:hypothetical protein
LTKLLIQIASYQSLIKKGVRKMSQNIDGLPKVYLFRTGVQVSSPKGSPAAMGERGILVVGNVTYYTIERSGNYVMLPKGVFMCWMQLIHPNTKSEKRAFLVKQSGEYGHGVTNDEKKLAGFFIHQGNYPHHIAGCVAPGKTWISNGVEDSKAAMNEIINFCGGWGNGKKMMLEVNYL